MNTTDPGRSSPRDAVADAEPRSPVEATSREADRERIGAVVLWVLALGGLILAARLPGLAEPGPGDRVLAFGLLTAAGLLAASYRPAFRPGGASSRAEAHERSASGGLGLGGLALAPLLLAWGVVPVSIALGLAAALGGWAGARSRRWDLVPRRAFAWAAEVALASLAAGGWIWLRSGGPRVNAPASPQPIEDLAVALALYGATRFLLHLPSWIFVPHLPPGESRLAVLRRTFGAFAAGFALEGLGLALGLLLARLTLAAPDERLAVAALAFVCALLCAESTRMVDVLGAERSVSSGLAGELDVARRRDVLTGVEAEAGLEPALEEALGAARDAAEGLAVVVFDLDHLGLLNDRHGREAGHRAVVDLARSVERGLRPGDQAFRAGGDRIVALLRETAGVEALSFGEAVRRDLEAAREIEGTPALTASAGIAAYPEVFAKSGAELLLLAEGAVRCAKELGRNVALLDEGHGRFRSGTGQEVETGDGTLRRARARPSDPPTFFA